MGLYTFRPWRFVIPRWRDFRKTSASGELIQARNKNSPAVPLLSIQTQLKNWQEETSVGNAIDLINSAFTSNNKDAAKSAAEFIVAKCPDSNHPILRVCRVILNDESPEVIRRVTGVAKFDSIDEKIRKKIHVIRDRLKSNIYNPFVWLDYARWLTISGKTQEAEKHVRTALHLAPKNSYVLRCAVRFFLLAGQQTGRKDDDNLIFALNLVRKNPATKFDPWLMATEISLSGLLQKSSRLIKPGFSAVENKNFNSFSISELAAAIATEELKHGSNKSARRLFTASLIDPNENTIAQGEWATTKIGELPYNFMQANSFEALSYYDVENELWDESFDNALNWFVEEPFSSESANHASFLAGAVVDDNGLALRICDYGLRANPKEFALLNNKAYSLAVEGKIPEAEKVFKEIDLNKLKDNEKVAYNATLGLIYYGKGDVALGQFYYSIAEDEARKAKDYTKEFLVKLYKTRTEFIFNQNTLDEKTAFFNLLQNAGSHNHPYVKKIIDNLRKRLEVEPDSFLNEPDSALFPAL
jgi:tetratricopeptide (TPR) repeat protein